MVKQLIGLGLGLTLVSAGIGCATLKAAGVLDDQKEAALCVDAANACTVAALVNAPENLKTACAVAGAFCTKE